MNNNAWGALSDDTRREIVILLRSRPHTAGEISDQFSLSPACFCLSARQNNGKFTECRYNVDGVLPGGRIQ